MVRAILACAQHGDVEMSSHRLCSDCFQEMLFCILFLVVLLCVQCTDRHAINIWQYGQGRKRVQKNEKQRYNLYNTNCFPYSSWKCKGSFRRVTRMQEEETTPNQVAVILRFFCIEPLKEYLVLPKIEQGKQIYL